MSEINTPLVAVIIPTYNRERMIERALASVLSQTYQNLRVVIVDDCSTDRTREVVARTADSRVTYIRHDWNRGAQAARNTGVANSDGDLVAFLDSDDEWMSDKLALQVEKLLQSGPEVGMIYCGIRKVDQHGRLMGDRIPRCRGHLYEELLKENIIGGMSVALIRRNVLQTVGTFDEGLLARQDVDMWIRIAALYQIDFVPEPLVVYRVHNDRISVNREARLQGFLYLCRKLQKELGTRPRALANQYQSIARLYTQLGKTREARRYLMKSIRLNPRPKVLLRYALSLLR
jgi:glycosyltransferase involved in cell wall biosynthesis